MSAADAVARMLTMVPWLLERPGASVDETAAAFGVSRQVVLRDLDAVGYCGLPGLGGGDLFEVSIIEDRILVEMADELRRPLRLTPREALRLVLAGEAVSAALGDDVPALRSALDAVRTAAGVPREVEVELDEDGTVWLAPLRRAIDAGRRVRLAYRGRAEAAASMRKVDPWALQIAEGAWYLRGRDGRSGEARTFRLDRIADLEVLDVASEWGPEEHPPPPRYEPAPDDLEVTLLLDRSSRWLAESVQADEITELEDGRRRVRFRTDAPAWAVRMVLGAAPGVRVESPPELAAQVQETARSALARYA